MGDTRASIALASLVGLAVTLAVYYLSLHFIFEFGVCCADDASYAVIAKFLATRGLYGWPLSSDQFDLFSPGIGSGPALIVPAALAIKVLGAKTWVPGMTALLLFTCQLVGAGIVLGRYFSITGAILFIALLTASLNVISGWQWYFPILLGELPAFGFILIGAAALATGRGAFMAGLAFGVAFLTKQIVLFSECAIVLVWLGLQWKSHGWRTSLALFGRIFFGAAIPVLAFELCKVVVLGPTTYLDYFSRLTAITKTMAVGSPATLAERIHRFSEVILNDYFAGWNTAAAVAVGIVALIHLLRSKWDRANGNFVFGCVLFAGGLAHFAYVLFVSILWSRYFYIGVALITAAAVSPILSLRNLPRYCHAAAIASMLLTPSAVSRVTGWALADSNNASHLRKTVRFIKSHPNLPIASQSWATFYDVLFLLKKDREWVFFWGLERLKGRSYMVVLNTHFADTSTKEYQATVSDCRLELERGVYRVYVCGD
ncbi:MAG: hypothetical protein ACRDGM_13650 [bacterium]